MTRRTGLFALTAAVAAAVSLNAQVTFDRILRADREPQNWLSYSGTPFNQRYSPLTQITTANAKNLELQWIWQARSLEKFEATALAVDGVLYTVQAPNDVVDSMPRAAAHSGRRRTRRRRKRGRAVDA